MSFLIGYFHLPYKINCLPLRHNTINFIYFEVKTCWIHENFYQFELFQFDCLYGHNKTVKVYD